MPTPNDFSRVNFRVQQDDYKQSSLEQDDRSTFIKDNEPMLPAPAKGNYPRTFDSGNPPDFSYADTDDWMRMKREMIPGSTPKTGEYGPYQPSNAMSFPSDNMVPTPVPSKQFSSKMSGDPKELLQNAKHGVEAHADLLNAYGYGMPLATVGTHAWLRDGLATTNQQEPGNAQPETTRGFPMDQDKKD